MKTCVLSWAARVTFRGPRLRGEVSDELSLRRSSFPGGNHLSSGGVCKGDFRQSLMESCYQLKSWSETELRLFIGRVRCELSTIMGHVIGQIM